MRDPVGHGLDRGRDEGLVRRFDLAFGDAHDLERPLLAIGLGPLAGQARLGEQPLHVLEHLAPVVGFRREPVHDHEQRQPALADPTEHEPRNPVRVARGRRHEDRQVRRFDEAVGQLSVGMLDAVDVGCVHEREALRDARVGVDPEALHVDARERALAQRGGIVGVRQDDGGPGRRPQDAGRARCAARDRVEQRALAGSGRPEQEHDQRGIQAPGSDSDVSPEVIAQARGPGPGGIGRGPHRPAALGEPLEPVDQLAQAHGRNRDLGLGAVIHAHRVPHCGGDDIDGTARALSVPLQTVRFRWTSSDVGGMDIRRQIAPRAPIR